MRRAKMRRPLKGITMKQGKGRIIRRSDGKWFIYLPARVATDSAFPFEPGEKVMVSIDGERLIIEKLKGRQPPPKPKA